MSRADSDPLDLSIEVDRLRSRIAELERERGLSQTSEQRYRLLIERMNEGFVATDRANRIDLVNAKLVEMLGYSRAELQGRYLGNFADEENLRKLERQEDRRRQGVAEPYELTWTTRDGRLLDTVISPTSLQDAEGRFVGSFAVITDVSERRRLERERHKLRSRVRKAQKMESLGLLAGGVAHDFNNLLVGVLGHAGLALMDLPRGSPARDLIKQVEIAAIRASELTREMLAYSGKGKFVVESIDLGQLVEEMAQLLKVTISKKAALELDFARGLPVTEGDPSQIRQVVMNLITNASEALGDAIGTLRISTGVVDADRAYLEESYMDDGLSEGRYVFLEVTDTGVGMDRETRSKIFDPFFTTKFTGRGLGLAAVLGIVRGHRGAIRVTSELDHGTSFRVLLPVIGDAVATMGFVEQEASLARGSGCVLVIDDEEMVRSVAKLTLETAGYQVLLATDGVEGVEAFRRHCEDLSAVVLDMTMPRMGGEEAYREIRRIRGDVKVILSSGFTEQEAIHRFDGQPLAGFLQKPFQPQELIETMRQALAG